MRKIILVYGGSGALGRECVKTCKSQNFKVISVDIFVNNDADLNITINSSQDITDQCSHVLQNLSQIEEVKNKLTAIICVAGGWAGGSSGDKDMISNFYTLEKQSLWSSVICAHLAAKFLTNDGSLILTGAKAALEPTPGMIGYGMVKAAVHHLTRSLAKDHTLPNESWVAAILPVTLDTEANRRAMPSADISTWTPLNFVANLLLDWVTKKRNRPPCGSLAQLITSNYETTITIE